MDAHLMGIHFMGMHLIGVYLTGVHVMGMYKSGVGSDKPRQISPHNLCITLLLYYILRHNYLLKLNMIYNTFFYVF
jgi:hypothetical protein